MSMRNQSYETNFAEDIQAQKVENTFHVKE